MTFRSVQDTARDTLKWIEEEETEERRDQIMSILNSGNEDKLLEAWKARESEEQPERQSSISPRRYSLMIRENSGGRVQV